MLRLIRKALISRKNCQSCWFGIKIIKIFFIECTRYMMIQKITYFKEYKISSAFYIYKAFSNPLLQIKCFQLVGKNLQNNQEKKSYLTAFVKEFLRLPTTMATSSRLTSSTSTTSLAHAEAEAGGEDTVAKELGGRTKPRLISLSMRSTCLLFNWFFLELFLDRMDNPKDAKLELLLSLLSVRLNCFWKTKNE